MTDYTQLITIAAAVVVTSVYIVLPLWLNWDIRRKNQRDVTKRTIELLNHLASVTSKEQDVYWEWPERL